MPGTPEIPKSLGFLFADWIAWHCVVPNGFDLGKPFELVGWQLENAIDFYRVKPDAVYDPARPRQAAASNGAVDRSSAARSSANHRSARPWPRSRRRTCVFCGWAKGGETFRCSDWGCSCGFEYSYSPGEPMGMPRRTALIQLLATSEEQTANVYRPLQSMVRNGRLADLMKVREGFIRLPNDGRIDPVTASAHSKLGNPVNFVLGDESGIWTRRSGMFEVGDTVMRGAWPWTAECSNSPTVGPDGRQLRPDDLRIHRNGHHEILPPARPIARLRRPEGSTQDPRIRLLRQSVGAARPGRGHRERAHARDPAQARRFYGCEVVQGLGSYMPEALYDATAIDREPPKDAPRSASASTAPNPETGPPCARRPSTAGAGRRPTAHPGVLHIGIRSNGRDASHEARSTPACPNSSTNTRCSVFIATRIRGSRRSMNGRAGSARTSSYRGRPTASDACSTRSPASWRHRRPLHHPLGRPDGQTAHDGRPKIAKPGDKFVLGKPSENQKIDITMADILAHEAASDMRALGWSKEGSPVMVYGW